MVGALFGRPWAPETEPIKSWRFYDLTQDLGSGILKVDQRALSCATASHHGIGNALADLVTVLIRWNPLADILQRRRHVGDGVLVELCQHFSLRPKVDSWSFEIGGEFNSSEPGRERRQN
jgi:hypothetical protein